MAWIGLHIVNHGTLSNRDILECIALADELGYAGVTLNEDVGQDSFALLSVAATRTRRVVLGTAITNVYFRTAMQVAMGAVTLDDLSQGRAQLGLSIGHHPWNDRYHGVPMDTPMARLREYVSFIRKASSGQPFTHDGPIFRGIRAQLDQTPAREHLPIHICGEGPRMLELAGEVADGAILNLSTPAYLREVAVNRVAAGARRAGRDPSELEITSVVTCCVGDDREVILRAARETFMERLGGASKHLLRGQPPEIQAELEQLRELVRGGNRERASAALSNEIVTSLIAAGTAHEVQSVLQRHLAAGCTRVLVAPYPRTRANVERTLRALAGGGVL